MLINHTLASLAQKFEVFMELNRSEFLLLHVIYKR